MCKISGMVTEAKLNQWKPADFIPYLDVVLHAFGPDRLMFGSDWPVCLLEAEYAAVAELADRLLAGQLSDAERSRIFVENAVEFYGLKLHT
jgi:L-fuconolactonase